jgi:hypothetical protein
MTPLRVAISQSNYIPWRGYFDLIDDVDLFIYLDDVQYTARDWRNRNKIKTNNGTIWLTVPVVSDSRQQLISDTRINYQFDWNEYHVHQIHHFYKKAPFYSLYSEELVYLLRCRYETISQLNQTLAAWVVRQLDIKTQLAKSSAFEAEGRRLEKIIALLKKSGATCYVSGPAAESYIELERFKQAGIGLEYKTYNYDAYPQLYGPFNNQVSILDLLFNVGSRASSLIKSTLPNTKIL